MRARWVQWVVLGLAGCVASAALLAGLFEMTVTCGLDSNSCARAGGAKRWEGRLFDAEGRPMAGRLRLSFPSRPDGEEPITAAGDPQGRFCVLWPEEREATDTDIAAGPARGAPDQRAVQVAERLGAEGTLDISAVILAGPAVGDLNFNGGVGIAYYKTEIAGLRECNAAGTEPAWYRVDGAYRNWRALLVLGLAVGALMTVAAAALFGRARPRRVLLWLAPIASAAAGVAYLLVWGPVS